MTENANTQKIKIQTITIRNTNKLTKEFCQEQYYLDLLVNQKFPIKSSPIRINMFYESYDIDCEILFFFYYINN